MKSKIVLNFRMNGFCQNYRPSPTNMRKKVLTDPRPTSDSKNVNNKRLPRPGVAVPFQHKPPRFHNMLRKLYKDSKVNLTGEIEECSQSVRQFYFIIIFNYLCFFQLELIFHIILYEF